MKFNASLPPGQQGRNTFPRFGMSHFANRFPKESAQIEIQIGGDVRNFAVVGSEFEHVDRTEQCSDFHCVTTWTCTSLRWSGIRFSDFYHQLVLPLADPSPDATFVVLRGQDGYRSSLPLEYLLAPDVLLADRLDGQALSIEHGAPLRLVAPAHYGYKSVKHINRIEFWRSSVGYRPLGFRFMTHPTARVAHEERGLWVPNRILRYLYRPLILPAVLLFERAMRAHRAAAAESYKN